MKKQKKEVQEKATSSKKACIKKEKEVEWVMTVKSFEKNGCMINSN